MIWRGLKGEFVAQLYDTNPIYDDMNERALWSPFNSSFSSEYCTFGGAAAKVSD